MRSARRDRRDSTCNALSFFIFHSAEYSAFLLRETTRRANTASRSELFHFLPSASVVKVQGIRPTSSDQMKRDREPIDEAERFLLNYPGTNPPGAAVCPG